MLIPLNLWEWSTVYTKKYIHTHIFRYHAVNIVLYNYSDSLLVRLPWKSKMILMNGKALFHGSSVYLLRRHISMILVSNRISKSHTFLVSVTCLKYHFAFFGHLWNHSDVARGGFVHPCRWSAGFPFHCKRDEMLFFWLFKSSFIHIKEMSRFYSHFVVCLNSLPSVQG